MGRVTPEHLYHILWAANRFSRNADPPTDINNYLIANHQWTANVRADSGQPDAWRDYQQVLSELGLIYSREVLPGITPTPLGMAFLDGSLGFSEIMTLQALRLQYPNGHQVMISAVHRAELAGTIYADVGSLAELYALSGVMIRPAVLVWRVLRRLLELGSASELTVDDFEIYLMRCSTNADYAACAVAIHAARNGGAVLPSQGQRQRRNAQDWIKYLQLTSIYSANGDSHPVLTLSSFGCQHAAELDEICTALENPDTFWQPGTVSQADRLRWYSQFGGVDLSIPELPAVEATEGNHEFVGGEEEDDQRGGFEDGVTGGNIDLREFQGIQLPAQTPQGLTIQSIYSAELSNRAHRLHDQMVLLIAETCQRKGATVFEDPGSVDLLVQHRRREFIIEVKSVTPRNFISRLRYALGQVLHYDYLRTTTSQLPRRRVIAFAAHIPANSWSVDFVNRYMDMDMLALNSGQLRLHSDSPASVELFMPVAG
jgi:hypothetical protein